MSGPLEGISIVELGTMIAVPGATNVLVNQGASSVKVEDTGKGDNLRWYGSQKGGMSGWFANANAGKRSIALDLTHDTCKDVLWKLIEDCDVFIQGFRPGVIDRLGFGYDEASSRNPTLVYVSSSGFGLDGPHADRPAYDPIIQALAGWAGSQDRRRRPDPHPWLRRRQGGRAHDCAGHHRGTRQPGCERSRPAH